MAVERPEGPEGPERLSSNVMNYLVWRYLQEAGYGKTAKQLQYQWTGKDESPENLPFAPNIKKGCLVHLVQDGLFLDHLQAEVKQTERQYFFGPDHGPKFSVPVEEPRERRLHMRETSRIPSHGDRDTQNGSATDTTTQRRPKGKRKSGGSERRMNGDMMDVDMGGLGPVSSHDPTVAEAESPMPAIEELPLVDTLSIGQSKEISTEEPRDLTPDTSFVQFDHSVELEHVIWSPHNKTALLTAGKNHMRTYKIGNEEPGNHLHTVNNRISLSSDNYSVEAFCWTERGSAAFSNKETYRNEDGIEMTSTKLQGFTQYGSLVQLVDPLAGTILSLQYNPSSKLLLCLSYGDKAVIQIWHYSESIVSTEGPKKRTEPKFVFTNSKMLGAELFDAAWVSDNKFIVCGIGNLEVYEIANDEISLAKTVHTEQDWFRMKFDPICEIAALLDEQMHALGTMKLDGDLKIHNETFQDTSITDFGFQPILRRESYKEGSPRLLATSTTHGEVQIWNALGPLTCLHKLSLGKQTTAQVLAFSPDGFLLAAAGYDTLCVWKPDEGGEPKAIWKMSEPNERWKSVPTEGDKKEEQEEENWLHRLSWDSDGKKIAFGLNNQVAIIKLLPPVAPPSA